MSNFAWYRFSGERRRCFRGSLWGRVRKKKVFDKKKKGKEDQKRGHKKNKFTGYPVHLSVETPCNKKSSRRGKTMRRTIQQKS